PNDPALVTLEYVNNGALSTGQYVTISSVTIEGEQIASGVNLGPSDPGIADHAWTALINPNLGTGLGGTGQDFGDTGTPGTAIPSQDTGTPLSSGLSPVTDPLSNYTSTGYTGSIGYLYDTTGAGTGGGT